MSQIRLVCHQIHIFWFLVTWLICGQTLCSPRDVLADVRGADNAFSLHDGDRIVLLGGTHVERMQQHGYLEAVLTAAFPDKKLSFRNLAWAGDTVWSESRGLFDPPQVGYSRLLKHVGEIRPNIVFLGYGANEAFGGEAKLQSFDKQYRQLIKDLRARSAPNLRLLFLQPFPHEVGRNFNRVSESYNLKLRAYRNVISQIAREQQAPLYDFAEVIQQRSRNKQQGKFVAERLTTNNVHLKPEGYRLYAEDFSRKLLGKPAELIFNRTADDTWKQHPIARVATVSPHQVKIEWSQLPPQPLTKLQLPAAVRGGFKLRGNHQKVVFRKVDNDGFLRDVQSPAYLQFEKLRKAIVEKNRAYFLKWRPQNITYLTGFRKHEQGQNAAELAEFDALAQQWEQRIDEFKRPIVSVIEFEPIDKPQ